MSRRARFGLSIQAACLPPREVDYIDVRATVAGWGTLSFGGPSSANLQEVDVRIWKNNDCHRNYQRLGRNVLDTMLCAGGDDDGKDACQGDSGGPLNCPIIDDLKYELCGIVSWGARCAEKDFPGVYTRVSRYLDWIEANAT